MSRTAPNVSTGDANAPDLASRRAVWEALSCLYLDVPLRDAVAWALPALVASPYTVDELRAILLDEVHPILWSNLVVPAGVWDAFDREWLAASIQRNLARPRWRRARGWCDRAQARRVAELIARRIARRRAAAARRHDEAT